MCKIRNIPKNREDKNKLKLNAKMLEPITTALQKPICKNKC